MNYWESHTQVAVRFRRFDRKRYAAFRSMPDRRGSFRRAGRGRSYRLPCAYRTESSDQDRDSHSRP